MRSAGSMMRAVALLLATLLPGTAAFVAPSTLPRSSSVSAVRSAPLTMGPAKDGPFTPAVKLARLVLGDQRLLKLRGKAISYHSQFINQFCADYGVPKRTNQALIKKAKVVGSDLGFLS